MNAAGGITGLKQPPHSIEAEQALIAGAMFHDGAAREIEIPAGDFYRKEHRLIWEAIQSLVADRQGLDVITVSERLRDTRKLEEAGGIDYLGDLLSAPSTRNSMQTYAAAIRGKAAERQLIGLGHYLADVGYQPGATQTKMDDAERAIGVYMRRLEAGEVADTTLPPVIKARIEALEYRTDHPGQLMGAPTGFTDMDELLGGFVDGDMIIVAGRPSMGKTTMAINIAENFAQRGDPVVVFSLEMPKEKLVDRMLCSICQLDMKRFRRGELTDQEWENINGSIKAMRQMPLFIDGNRRMTSEQLVSRTRRICYRQGIPKPKLVVLDYLQLMVDDGEGHERVSRISRNVKLAAEELECPVMVLSQLNRGLEQRPNKRPIMSDLRDSGSLEQDADVIAMLYRDIVYNPGTADKGIAECLIRKARDAPVGEFKLADHLHRSRFSNLAKNYQAPPPMSYHGGGKDLFQY